ncbi:MAG: hypothetical protein HY815_26625 [Candidatus Riflebacteria bacterium]|nr:hypothetical protein [Candidatus Riflebacteria bacterium]
MGGLEDEIRERVIRWRRRIGTLPGKHVAVEFIWDGDTSGWWLDVCLVMCEGLLFHHYRSEVIDTLRCGGDGRLFSGSVPPWPEAVIANRAGEQVARELGLAFFFPSPDDPDDGCPHWWQRNQAVACTGCGKLLLVERTRPGFRFCARCDLARRTRREILEDSPGISPGYFLFTEADGRVDECVFTSVNGELAGHLASAFAASGPEPISGSIDEILEPASLDHVVESLRRRISVLIPRYGPRAGCSSAAESARPIVWEGRELVIETSGFNPVGEEIWTLLCHMDTLTRWTRLGRTVHLLGNGGPTRRDVAILDSLRHGGGPTDLPQLHAAFPYLTESELLRTVAKLERRRLVQCRAAAVLLTVTGSALTVAGP